jgi:hypothetical protein
MNLCPSFNQFSGPTLILRVVTYSPSGEGRLLWLGDIKMQGLLLSLVKRFDCKISLKVTSLHSKLGSAAGSSPVSAHCGVTELPYETVLLQSARLVWLYFSLLLKATLGVVLPSSLLLCVALNAWYCFFYKPKVQYF